MRDMIRSMVYIHEELCNGCGLCITACHEGALELIDGKAKLVSDIYCDGLGACLPNCPTGAIEIIEREAEDFDEAAVEKRVAEMQRRTDADEALARYVAGGQKPGSVPRPEPRAAGHHPHGHHSHDHGHAHHHHAHGMGGCPGSMSAKIERTPACAEPAVPAAQPPAPEAKPQSELQQWPIQIQLVHPAAPFFQNANLLVAADCTAFAYGDFHRDFIKNHITVIGCPKLDDNAYYAEKLTEILSKNEIKSITVVRMVVPCCGGIVQAVKQAMLQSGTIVPYREVTVGLDGLLVQ